MTGLYPSPQLNLSQPFNLTFPLQWINLAVLILLHNVV